MNSSWSKSRAPSVYIFTGSCECLNQCIFLGFKTNHCIPCTPEFAPQSLCLYALLRCVRLTQRIVYSAYTTGLIQLDSDITPHFTSSKKPVSSLCEPVVGVFCTGPQFCTLLIGVSVFYCVVSACTSLHVDGATRLPLMYAGTK